MVSLVPIPPCSLSFPSYSITVPVVAPSAALAQTLIYFRDSSWEQDINNKPFREQVEWELNALDNATVIAMFFDPASKAPISLLELGLYAASGRMAVCCPEGYWRRGNVQIICDRFKVKLVGTMEELIKEVVEMLKLEEEEGEEEESTSDGEP